MTVPSAPAAPTLPRDLAGFRNLHAGATLVVCGCGASLNDLRAPERFLTIGVNDVGRLFDPTYLVVLNPRHQFQGDRFSYVAKSRARALFTQLDLGLKHLHVVRFRLGQRGGTGFDDPGALHYTRNSPYVALCLAVHMGAARIGLIGVDFTDHHFFGATGRHSLSGQLAQIDREYARLAQACAARGVEVMNLSRQSRLKAFAKCDPDEFGGADAAVFSVPSVPEPSQVIPRREGMKKVAIEKHQPGIVGDFLNALAGTAQQIGFDVRRIASGGGTGADELAVVWNGRSSRASGPRLYCEHAWLPRWEYQISPRGINADSHLAPFVWDGHPLSAAAAAELDRHLETVRSGGPDAYRYMQTAAPAVHDLPGDFLLVPLQMEWDTNIQRHVPVRYRRMQALVDDIARSNPSCPVIYKQHPADVRRGNAQLRLRVGRRQDVIRRHDDGNIHQLLKSGRCRGIVSLNSNVVHDGLLWDIPAVVLGHNIWPRSGPAPFLTALPGDWSKLFDQLADPAARACRQAYAWYLMKNQWTLDDMRRTDRVEELLTKLPALAPARPAAAAPRPAPVARPRRTAAAAARSRPARRGGRRVNVVAANRGWFFEDLKRHFLAAARPDVQVLASETPVKNADAWIFVRTKEAAVTPDPARTLVQIHDMFEPHLYRPGGERACVAACGAVAFTHPDQKRLLAEGGIDLARKEILDRPIGALQAFTLRRSLARRFTVAWVGRPVQHAGQEIKRVDWFVRALQELGGDVEAVLLGERLEEPHRRLVRAKIPCRYLHRSHHRIEQYPRHYQSFDCVVVCSTTEAGPLCLFESMATGVPVVSTSVGWAPLLVRDGETGYLAESVAEIAGALASVRAHRAEWLARKEAIREAVAGYTLESWVSANLEMALRLGQGAQGA